MKKLLTLAALLSAAFGAAYASGVAAYWQTIDDETSKPKSVVSVYEQGGEMFGKILFTYNDAGAPDFIDGKCNPAKTAPQMGNAPYCALLIIANMKPGKDGKYSGGTITDPQKGKTYKAEMWREGNTLKVKGKLGPFSRTQTWIAYAGVLPTGE